MSSLLNTVPTAEMKFVLLGSGGVGKSALVMRLMGSPFLEKLGPTIEDLHRHELKVDDKLCKLAILDTAGQQDFHSMEDTWFQDGEGFLMVYSIISKTSFVEVANTYDRLVRSKDGVPPMVLVANKSDLNELREVSYQEGAKLAAKWGCPFFETSAKLSQNEHVFAELVRVTNSKGRPKPRPEKEAGCGCAVM